LKREKLASIERQVEEEFKPAKQRLQQLEQTKTEANDQEKELRATVDRLQIQLEESLKSRPSGQLSLEMDTQRLKVENEELVRENKSLKVANESFTNAMHKVASLKRELEQAHKQLSILNATCQAPKIEVINSDGEVIASLKESIQKERAERSRLEKDNLRMVEKIRLMNTRRSISEAESQIDLGALRKITMNGIFRTAFVNGSKMKKLISFYILLIHILLLYHIFKGIF
jgi:hypothetical protein